MLKLKFSVRKKIHEIPKHHYHKLIHEVHKKHKISKRTLFYMKQYGSRSHATFEIIKDSLEILVLTSIISSLGGIGLQSIRAELFKILPLLIVVPALNDMVGDFGTITSLRFTTALFLGELKKKWWKDKIVKALFIKLLIVIIIFSFYIGFMSYLISLTRGFAMDIRLLMKILQITLLTTITLFMLIFLVSIAGGFWLFKRQEDPNNFLIPITTAIADFGAILVFAALVKYFLM